MYYVYVLYSAEYDKIYIGQTNDIGIRIERHNSRKVKSTKAYIPWELVHYEKFATRSELHAGVKLKDCFVTKLHAMIVISFFLDSLINLC